MVSSNWTHECKAKTMMKINTNRRTNTQQVYKHKLRKKGKWVRKKEMRMWGRWEWNEK